MEKGEESKEEQKREEEIKGKKPDREWLTVLNATELDKD